jgi:pimeloyl-ACP methyl ester carboxylesterase
MSKTRDTEAPHALEVVPDVGHFLHIEAPRRSERIAAWAE